MGLQYTIMEGARWRCGAVHKNKIEAALAPGDPSEPTRCAKIVFRNSTRAASELRIDSDWMPDGDSWDSVTLPRRLQILWGSSRG